MADIVHLRLLCKDDFTFIYTLYCEKSQIYWGGHLEEPNEASLKAWFDDLLKNPNVIPFIISDMNEDVGFCRLKISSDNSEICEDFPISISERFRGRGYGTMAISLLISEARMNYGIRYMYGWVLDTNEASKKMCLKNGFQPTGNMRGLFVPLEGKNITMHEYVRDTGMGS